jgi:hypothetical protein
MNSFKQAITVKSELASVYLTRASLTVCSISQTPPRLPQQATDQSVFMLC